MAALKKVASRAGKEIEFWSAREIHVELGYAKWDNFVDIIEKSKENCSKIKANPQNHFAEVKKMVPIGSGAFREQIDYVLSRTACYLIALNGDAGKPQIAWAKAYFVVQTQIQEAAVNKITDADERRKLRDKLKEANKQLGGAAKQAGVQNYGFFHAAGIRGLYGMTMAELKTKKGIKVKEEYWDRVCGLELSANEFKAQLAKKTIEQKKKSGEIHGQEQAEKEHQRVAKTVRTTIHTETGIHLENLSAEPSLKKLLSQEKKKARALNRPDFISGQPSATE